MAGSLTPAGQPAGPTRLNRIRNAPRLLWAQILALLAIAGLVLRRVAHALPAPHGPPGPGFRREESGSLNIGALMGTVFIVIGAILAAVLGMVLLNAFAPLYFTSLSGLIGNLTGISTGSDIGDAILSIVVIIVSIVGPVAFLGLAVAVIAIKVRGGKGTS